MRTYIYIDGFNLYNRALKRSPYRWLDLRKLSENILMPHNKIECVKYFTAKVSELGDPKRPGRQRIYLKALQEYIDNIEIYYGQFLSHKKKALIADPPPPPKQWVTVQDIKEKGTDVSLAVHMLNDAWLDRYDCALLMSNDSDIAEAIKLIKIHHPKKMIGLVVPNKCTPSKMLLSLVHFRKALREGTLKASQLPSPIPGTNITKPTTW